MSYLTYLQKAENSFNESQTLFDKGLYDGMASRAYYAAYQLACVALHNSGQLDIEEIRKHNHKSVKIAFSKFIREENLVKFIKGYLEFLLEYRMTADYEPKTSLSHEEAKEILDKLIQFFQIIKDYLNM